MMVTSGHREMFYRFPFIFSAIIFSEWSLKKFAVEAVIVELVVKEREIFIDPAS